MSIITKKEARQVIRRFFGPGRAFRSVRLLTVAERLLGADEAKRIERRATLERLKEHASMLRFTNSG